MNKILLAQQTEIEYSPALISLKLYLEKLEKLNDNERKVLPKLLETLMNDFTVKVNSKLSKSEQDKIIENLKK
jgi:hypothetical protein